RDDKRVSRFFKIARQRPFDPGTGTWFSGSETRRSLVLVRAPLAGSTRSKPSAPCRLARHARGSLVLLRARRSQTPSCGFGVNWHWEQTIQPTTQRPMTKFPMTAAGYSALQDELNQRMVVERPRLIQRMQEAIADDSNLAENSEYHAAQEGQQMNEAR